ncbi:hypothetical protein N7532_006060 [Penicillium argentinense]|uniref:Uncharacterized protein n=1 Tax=Penicillium argentinense TaxID=1131581 RepID=A0A9W9KAE4_9EURO|nr:uncharacterized protein N7532_006060 [Penicillium argentinense]KAJ5099059.1 hypothetical protein N7532_006060 [Penicillium argentinense]
MRSRSIKPEAKKAARTSTRNRDRQIIANLKATGGEAVVGGWSGNWEVEGGEEGGKGRAECSDVVRRSHTAPGGNLCKRLAYVILVAGAGGMASGDWESVRLTLELVIVESGYIRFDVNIALSEVIYIQWKTFLGKDEVHAVVECYPSHNGTCLNATGNEMILEVP